MSGMARHDEDSGGRLRRAAALAVLDRLPYALLLVDRFARVVISNTAARRALSSGTGLLLDADVLSAAVDGENAQLRASIARATRPAVSWLAGAGALWITRGSSVLPVLILPAQVGSDTLLGQHGYAYVLLDASRHTPHRDLLIAMYGFTPREVDLACELVAGKDLADAARVLRVTIHTARTHLKHLMEKTATKRQGDLVRLLLRSTVPRA
jgi:DNA-binding CsgD family transcriptional regulator